MVYVIQVPSWSCSQAVSKPVWHIPLLCVQWKTPHDGQRNCPKHVEFYCKNNSEKLVHLFGFIIRIHNDARSPERRNEHQTLSKFVNSFCGERRCTRLSSENFHHLDWPQQLFVFFFEGPKFHFKYKNEGREGIQFITSL